MFQEIINLKGKKGSFDDDDDDDSRKDSNEDHETSSEDEAKKKQRFEEHANTEESAENIQIENNEQLDDNSGKIKLYSWRQLEPEIQLRSPLREKLYCSTRRLFINYVKPFWT